MTPDLLAALHEAPDLAAIAAAHPKTFAALVVAWSDPLAELVRTDPPTDAYPAVGLDPLGAPRREPAPLFDAAADLLGPR